jgi:glycosyltransferase involved in cell wall biosynthesis
MNILFILKDFKPGGGVERVQQRLAGQFLADGQQVGYFVINGDPVAGQGATVAYGAGGGVANLLKSVRQLRRLIDREGVTHLVAAKEQANLCAWLATLGSRCNVIYTRHVALDSSGQSTNPGSLRLLYALYLCGSGKVVTVSRSLRQTLARLVPWGARRISFCPNAVVTAELLNAAHAPLPAGLPQTFWLGVGRLAEQKGFDLLLPAYAAALRSAALPDLVIAGDGPDLQALQAQAQQLGIATRVHFTGFLDNPYPLLKAADLFVLSSRHEGLPTVLIEALALGTRVLATDCETGPRELLDNGRLGRLVNVNDIAALTEGLLQSLPVASVRGAQASESAVHAYTSQQAAQAYYQVWNQ